MLESKLKTYFDLYNLHYSKYSTNQFTNENNSENESQIELIRTFPQITTEDKTDYFTLIDLYLLLKNIDISSELELELMDELDNDEKYQELLAMKKKQQLSPINRIQTFENKLFLEHLENGKRIYHFYFSYGNLSFLEYVHWKTSLKPYIDMIKIMVSDSTIDSIILGGHSIGSIVIQHLAIELIKHNIETSKIFIIGTGCHINNVLDELELELFRKTFNSRYIFLLNSYIENDILYVESNSNSNSTSTSNSNSSSNSIINKITTHLLISDNQTENGINKVYISSINDIENENDIEKENEKEKICIHPSDSIILHDFSYYSELFRILKKSKIHIVHYDV